MKINFYKEAERWYADTPYGTKEDNEMVFGADTFLERVSMGYDNVYVEITDKSVEKYDYCFKLIEHDEYGGTYANVDNDTQIFWLCNLTHDVCGEHPSIIYITKIIAL